MQGRWRVGSLFGVPLFVDYTWIPVAALMAVFWGPITVLGLFASVLAHEMAHTLVAKSQGLRVNSIILYIFGGISAIEGEAATPAGAFWIAAAGPLTNLGLAASLWALLALAPPTWIPILASLAAINWAIGLFNLLPGLPLDGGHMLKAAVWGWTKDRNLGLLWAARVGQFLGFGLLGLGLLAGLTGNFNGLWFGLIGLFIVNNARNYAQYSRLQQALGALTAADAMTRNFRVLDLGLNLREFVDRYVVLAEPETYFAEADGRYKGLVMPDKVRPIERSQWEQLDLSAILRPMEDLEGVEETTPLARVIARLQGNPERQVVVLTPSGSVAGLIDRGDIVSALGRRLGLVVPPPLLQQIRDQNTFPPGFPVVPNPVAEPESDPGPN